MYEPVYVSRPDVPQFDERFIGYGMTRNTQVGVLYSTDLALSSSNFQLTKVTWDRGGN